MVRINRNTARVAPVLGLTLLIGCAAQQPSPHQEAMVDGEASVNDAQPFASAAGEAGYHLLMAEIARSRGEWQVSASEYRQAADLSDDPETAARAARVAYDHGEWEEARLAARRWHALAPADTRARYMLTALELRAGNVDAARELLFAMLAEAEADGWLSEGFAKVATLLDAEGVWQTSLPLMRDLVRRYRDEPDAHLNLATLCLRARRPDEAVGPAREAVRLDPQSLRGHVTLATALLEAGDTAGALEVAAAGETLPEAGAEYRLHHARLLAAAGQHAGARVMLEALLAQRPTMTEALAEAGLLAQRAGHLDEARGYFRRMLSSGQRTEAIYHLARTEELDGNLESAGFLYRQVTDGRYLVLAQVRRAELLARFGRADEALVLLDELATTHPRFEIDFIQARAALLGREGRGDQALELYGEAIDRWPDDTALRYARAFLLLDLDRVAPALADLQWLVEATPDDATALNALGYTLADRTDRFREAHRYLRRALQLDPDNGAIVDSLGWLEYRRGRPGRAIAWLRRAWALLPDPEIAAHLGEALWMAGSHDEARAVWQEALARWPESAQLHSVTARFAE